MIVAVAMDSLGCHIVCFPRKEKRIHPGLGKPFDNVQCVLIDIFYVHAPIHFVWEDVIRDILPMGLEKSRKIQGHMGAAHHHIIVILDLKGYIKWRIVYHYFVLIPFFNNAVLYLLHHIAAGEPTPTANQYFDHHTFLLTVLYVNIIMGNRENVNIIFGNFLYFRWELLFKTNYVIKLANVITRSVYHGYLSENGISETGVYQN